MQLKNTAFQIFLTVYKRIKVKNMVLSL